MKKVTLNQIVKGIVLWIVLSLITVALFVIAVKLNNPFYVPEDVQEKIRFEEGI